MAASRTLDQAAAHLAHVDGVMLGRAAYQNPSMLLDIDAASLARRPRTLDDALAEWCAYVERKLKEGVRLSSMTRHMLGLFNGRPGARAFRRHLSENAVRDGAGIAVLRDALAYLCPGTRSRLNYFFAAIRASSKRRRVRHALQMRIAQSAMIRASRWCDRRCCA